MYIITDEQVADFPEDSLHRCEYCGFSALSLCSPLVRGLSRLEAHASLGGHRHLSSSSNKRSSKNNNSGSRLLAVLRQPLQSSCSSSSMAPENGSRMDGQTLIDPSTESEVQGSVESTNDNPGNLNSGFNEGDGDNSSSNSESGNNHSTFVGVHLKLRGQRMRGPGISTPFLPPYDSHEAAQLPGPLVHACCALAMHQVRECGV